MNTKTMIAGVLGGITYFLLGWLIYGILLKDSMGMSSGSAQGVMRADSEMIMWAMVIGNLAYGFALAYILSMWTGVSTFLGGAKAAGTVAFLLALGYNLIYYATSNLMGLNDIFRELAIATVMGAIAGGVIGWWLGRTT